VPAEAECTDGLPAELAPPPDGDDKGELVPDKLGALGDDPPLMLGPAGATGAG